MGLELETPGELNSDELSKIYQAVLAGRPDPYGTVISQAAYDEIAAEVAAAPEGTEWTIPNE
ncbi:MAG: hypothetical protein AB8G99_13760 [Planctomycetaceae bacterium]